MRAILVGLVLAILVVLNGRSGSMAAGGVQSASETGKKLTWDEFRALMDRLASSWNSNNAKRAAECFTADAVYSAPPSSRTHRGRQELFEFFGGQNGRPRPMSMQWHHLLFDQANQIGAGEYTFTYEIRTHGMVIVRVVSGKIANWREYEQESPLEWETFVGTNRF